MWGSGSRSGDEIQITDAIVREVSEDQKFTMDDICEWHHRWLDNVYEWAGRYRSVNLAKDDFQFAASHLVPRLMQEFSEKHLSQHTPCKGMDEEELVNALAIIHA